jgi:putative pyruvate formate lyase activating enzyme
VNRLEDDRKACRVGRYAIVSSAFAHPGEEDCLRGWRGSGTIFFAGCNLRCVFCQNWDISQEDRGREMAEDEIADLMLRLQDEGCHNVNLVTPEHVAPQAIRALWIAAERGLRLPVVWNTSAYDGLETLRRLDGIVDVYMPDLKFWKPETAHRYAKARDYPEQARAAIREMHRQVGVLKMDKEGIARRGVLVRHLVMPGLGDETAAILSWLARELSPDTFVNVMSQYRPEHLVGRPDRLGAPRYHEIDRRPSPREIQAARAAARAAGLHRFAGEH